MKQLKRNTWSRRRILNAGGMLAGASVFPAALPAWAHSGTHASLEGLRPVAGTTYDLAIDKARSRIDGQSAKSILVNGQLPAPLLRWREGDQLTLRVKNNLKTDTSIHWHGILLPFHMDGVPGVSFPGIKPGETFTYEFALAQAGTYWYHSHSGLQEQQGHYGPIIVEPREPDPVRYDREFVIVLSDWTFEDPHRVFAKLKKMSDNYNFQQRTVSEFFDDVEAEGFDRTVAERMMWGNMRMNPTDIADVTGATYTYLINGHGPGDNWTGLFRPGERVRLRFINAAAMSIFNVRIPDLPMTVVQADGLNVQPVETDEFQIGVAETFDVIVEPDSERAYTIMAESNDRSGYARATLAAREGLAAAVPPLRARPTLTMKDMAMDHSQMNHGDSAAKQGAVDHSKMDHAGHEMAMDSPDHAKMDHSKPQASAKHEQQMAHGAGQAEQRMVDHSKMDHSGHKMAMDSPDHAKMDHSMPPMSSGEDHSAHAESNAMQAHNHPQGPGVVGLAMNPVNRLGERPNGLEDEPHRVLVYTDLKSLVPNPDRREPGREIELHLTSNMERYMWSFDGLKFSEVDGPIIFHEGERLRLTLVNDTMMPHPIHLHGMFFDVVNGSHHHKPRKHTIVAKPGEKLSVDITADALGDWSFHCHLLYHMHAGMMRVVSIVDHENHA